MNATARKWTIQFLLPWCDNFFLDDTKPEYNLKVFSASTFLNSLFMQFTKVLCADGSEIPQEMFDLWVRLAKKYVSMFNWMLRTNSLLRPENLTVIVNFLLRKGIVVRDFMPISKTVIYFPLMCDILT